MTYLLFITALGLSAVAAYYSIMGLVAIFAAAATPIFIMGSLLEASKLVVASWLYRSWKEVPRLMKIYFTTALVILMMLTSMGIFGFLSKAHLDQAIPTGDVAAKLALIDEKIKTEKDNLNASRAELNQLDQQVNQTLSRTTDAGGAERSIAIRRGQQKDRQRILSEIGTTQTKIAKLNEERAPIASEVRKVEAEVGPIKYIAQLIYGQEAQDADFLEKAVRIVILLIVAVFDPLAVLLLVAANWQMKHEKGDVSSFFKQFETKQMRIDDFVPQPKEFVVEETPENKDLQTKDSITLDDSINIEEVRDEELNFGEPTQELHIEEKNEEHVKELGRYETELLEQERKRKVQSFLNKVGTIEEDVEKLNKNEIRM